MINPEPVDPAPMDPPPVDPAAIDPEPVDSEPADPAPIDPEPGPGSDPLAEELLATLGLVRRHLRRLVGRPWPQSPMTGSQSELIRLVRHNPGISVAEAAAELGLAANTVSTLVRQLTELDLLRRSPDEHDRRIARLSLTAPAQRQAEARRDRRIARVSQVLDRLDRADLDALRAALPTLNAIAEHLRPTQTQAAPGSGRNDRTGGVESSNSDNSNAGNGSEENDRAQNDGAENDRAQNLENA
ncbi:MarR family winged helix-turn-helix transcriptional regulator [Rugosimonospora africana]|uniref:HTH marR-type domain-containing protein n=1 Tax=Rugosimonospora africana TaxID=556532 RepID=A0A8J3QR41_9ACTN|nr:MarR family transcriptional regulator [Rugosimonospora africana]GIH14227.1 hypothetical protein Raf01_23990 [Rugosimonospora africana]